MNWEAIGAVGEIVGAAAVIATLLYLAVQVRQNNSNQRVSAKQEMTRQFVDYLDFLVTNPELADIHDRGLNGAELNDTEQMIFIRLMSKCTWYLSSMHFQYRVQALEEGDWEESKSLISYYCSTPGYQKFWTTRNRAHGPEFLTYMDNEIANNQFGK